MVRIGKRTHSEFFTRYVNIRKLLKVEGKGREELFIVTR